jgi:hypothetical protein
MTEGPGWRPSSTSRRVLRAILPIGVVLLITWIVWFVVEVAVGDVGRQGGISIVSAVLGLLNSLTLIVSGIHYRRSLGPE